MRTTPYALPVSLFLFLMPSAGKLMNITIDDFFGDPTNGQSIQYFPPTAWQIGNGCQPCTAKPTPASDTWLGTWHDATFNPNDTATNSALGQIIVASAQFSGTAVYVKCILTRSFTSPDGNTDMTFFLDDLETPAGVFQQTPNGDTSYRFDVTVFAKTDLPFGQHSVRLEAGHAGKKALVLLDSIIYTTDDGLADASSPSSSATVSTSSASAASPSPSSDKKINVGVVVGAVIAALAGITGMVLVIVIYLKRRRDAKGRLGGLQNDQNRRASSFANDYQGALLSETSQIQGRYPAPPSDVFASVVASAGYEKRPIVTVPVRQQMSSWPQEQDARWQSRPLPTPSNRTPSGPSRSP